MCWCCFHFISSWLVVIHSAEPFHFWLIIIIHYCQFHKKKLREKWWLWCWFFSSFFPGFPLDLQFLFFHWYILSKIRRGLFALKKEGKNSEFSYSLIISSPQHTPTISLSLLLCVCRKELVHVYNCKLQAVVLTTGSVLSFSCDMPKQCRPSRKPCHYFNDTPWWQL